MKYNELEITSGPQTFIFVTRGKAKPFTHLEALRYLDKREPPLPQDPKEIIPASCVGGTLDEFLEEEGILEEATGYAAKKIEELESVWRIPRDKQREVLFRADLMSGLGFCAIKYGQSTEVLIAEAQRLGFGNLINTDVIGG